MVFIFLCLFLFLTPLDAKARKRDSILFVEDGRKEPVSKIVDGNFGLVSFNICPGYNTLLVDYENLVFHSQHVLFPVGLHHLKVKAMSGYNDTTLVFRVEKNYEKIITVNLKETKTNMILRLENERTTRRKKAVVKKIFKANMLLMGMGTSILAGYHYGEEGTWSLIIMASGFFMITLPF